jgi:hypothetical protein
MHNAQCLMRGARGERRNVQEREDNQWLLLPMTC